MRRVLSAILLAAAMPLAVVAPASANGSTSHRTPSPAGLVVTESTTDFTTTRDALVTALEANPAITVLGQVDHQANAAGVGLDLGPTFEVFFGNPALGTPLMQADQVAGIDLPQKFLVWEADGDTFVAFNSVDYLAARHDVAGVETLGTIAGALATLTSVATGVPVEDVGMASDARDLLLVQQRPGLRSITSAQSFDDTVAGIRAAVDAGPPMEVFTLDHRANAASVGRELRPTTEIAFGSPALGTPLMQSVRSVGIDLPQKILVHQTASGEVRITWNDPRTIVRRHRVRGVARTVQTIDRALRGLAAAGADTA